ncbi:interleukin-37 [Perognathus longimembris pacificus]|uniref:interleukin-37 n=1 Tax=Perognathus longimembris pacificus TaxID=214514 RepID=UPI0020189FB8|nr:interleukin-37 [Perognathus longimembris pacificus]
MSVLAESEVRMDTQDQEEGDSQCCPGETFFVLASHWESAAADKNPISLAVSKGEVCLYCDKDKGKRKPSLQLKKKQLMSLIGQNEPVQKAFMFYKVQVGSRHTLESAANPGWFVCTSCNSGTPVGVTNKASAVTKRGSRHPVRDCRALSPSRTLTRIKGDGLPKNRNPRPGNRLLCGKGGRKLPPGFWC